MVLATIIVDKICVDTSNLISVSKWQTSNIWKGKHVDSTTQVTLGFYRITGGLEEKPNSVRFRGNAEIRQQNAIKSFHESPEPTN